MGEWQNSPGLYFTEKEMATHSSIAAWRIPWTEEPGGLWSTGSWRVRHDWVTWCHTSSLSQMTPCFLLVSLYYFSLAAEVTQKFIFYPIFFIDLWLGQCKQNGDGLLGSAGNKSAERQQAASLLPMTNSSTQGYLSPHVPWDLDDHIR